VLMEHKQRIKSKIMKSITCNIPGSLYQALRRRMETDKAT